MNQWTYRRDGDKWIVGKWVREIFRLLANGGFVHWHKPIETQVSDTLYSFDTEWAAQAQVDFCNKMDEVANEVRRCAYPS